LGTQIGILPDIAIQRFVADGAWDHSRLLRNHDLHGGTETRLLLHYGDDLIRGHLCLIRCQRVAA
jgi:hypothetical protein